MKKPKEMPAIDEYQGRLFFHCLKCEQVFKTSNRLGHCGVCCRTFIGAQAFDTHRVGEHGADRRCEDPSEIGQSFWSDERGYWHFSRRFDADKLNAYKQAVGARN